LRAATRAGQKAIAIQMMRPMMPKPNHTMSLLALVSLFSSDTTRTAKPAHHADWVNPPTFPPPAPPPDVVRNQARPSSSSVGERLISPVSASDLCVGAQRDPKEVLMNKTRRPKGAGSIRNRAALNGRRAGSPTTTS
jgi:hypothetical protein